MWWMFRKHLWLGSVGVLLVGFFLCWGSETPIIALARQKPVYFSAKIVISCSHVYSHWTLTWKVVRGEWLLIIRACVGLFTKWEWAMSVDIYDHFGAQKHRFLASQCYHWSFTSSTHKKNTTTSKDPTKKKQPSQPLVSDLGSVMLTINAECK
mgnify:CR=1 FL=1